MSVKGALVRDGWIVHMLVDGCGVGLPASERTRNPPLEPCRIAVVRVFTIALCLSHMSECIRSCEHSKCTCAKEVADCVHTGHMFGCEWEYWGWPGLLLQKNRPYVPFSHWRLSASVTEFDHSGESRRRLGHRVVVLVMVKRPSCIILTIRGICDTLWMWRYVVTAKMCAGFTSGMETPS